MSVTQISRIQARRGLQQDLPQLASAELGWSIDQRRLFIGNGTLTEGSPQEGVTEILTQYSEFSTVLQNYSFKGDVAGFTSESLTTRSYQDKLDDFANVRDFGAIGDGLADDSSAFNRAIRQLYASSQLITNPRSRRTLYVPAGTYNISNSTLNIPPFFRMVGDGIGSTIIKQTDASQPCLIQTADSLYQVGVNMGTNFATLPTSIDIESMTLQQNVDLDIFVLDSAIQVNFNKVNFLGSLNFPITPGSIAAAGVRVTSRARATNNITFQQCMFTNTRYALISDVESNNVRFTNCYFSGLYQGLRLATNSGSPTNYRVLNSQFATIANTAFECGAFGFGNASGFISSGNHFQNVGNNFGAVPVAVIINFNDTYCASIGDVFDRSDVDNLTFARIRFGAKNTALGTATGLILGSAKSSIGNTLVLNDNTLTFTNPLLGVENAIPPSCKINYTITRNGEIREGSITRAGNRFFENYSETSDLGITFGVDPATSLLRYTSTSTGINGTLKFNLTSFI